VAQIKALEAVLAGALRRELVADTNINMLATEIQQLNTMVWFVTHLFLIKVFLLSVFLVLVGSSVYYLMFSGKIVMPGPGTGGRDRGLPKIGMPL
jgi:hypothetical protein